LNKYESLSGQLATYERQFLIDKGKRETLEARFADLKNEVAKNQKLIKDFEEAIDFLVATGKKAKDNTIKSIELLATMAVNAVYDEPILIRLRYKDKSRTDSSDKIKLQVVTINEDGSEESTGLMNEVGGGLIETVSFALRIACIKWLGYNGPIILDEAYKSLSNDEKIERIATFLETLNTTVGNQIIFATHKQDVFGDIASKQFKVVKKRHDDPSKVIPC
jgi:DNA repair exonuclease SbcCD ATPase subunit